MHLQIHRDWRAAGEHLEGAAQAALGQDRRMDAARDLAHLLQRAGRLAQTAQRYAELRGQATARASENTPPGPDLGITAPARHHQ